jgi:hypothetical protein
MSSFKKLNKADVTTVPYAANKQWSLTYINNVINDGYIVYSTGVNDSFLPSKQQTTNNQYSSLIYSEINHLFYQSYTNLLDTGSLMFNVDTYQSASQQRPTASYFNYNINPLLIKQFPTGAYETIGVLSVNQNIYGSKILPTSLQISSSGMLIKDDGNGNLYDVYQSQNQYIDLNWVTSNYIITGSLANSGVVFVGNIFYAHGISVITNQDSKYQSLFPPACTSYDLSGGSTGTTFYYTSCGGIPTTSSVSIGGEITVCIDDSYSITVASGNGNYLDLDPCFGSTIISFQNEHIIYENEVRCIVKESDYNLSFNPSLLKYGGQCIVPLISGSNSIVSGSSNLYTLTGSFDSTVKDFATGSAFQPYVTTIGLYNDEDELLMVAKLGKPIVLSSDTDMTFIVKYDT